MNKTTVGPLLIIVLLALAVGGFYLLQLRSPSTGESSPTPMVSSVPEVTPINHPLIEVTSPQPEARVTSPMIISGQARGPWFFEATFPVVLTTGSGVVLAEGFAQAEGEWMTDNFVPFTARLEFTAPTSDAQGILILKKANASGLPENDDQVEIPVLFQK